MTLVWWLAVLWELWYCQWFLCWEEAGCGMVDLQVYFEWDVKLWFAQHCPNSLNRFFSPSRQNLPWGIVYEKCRCELEDWICCGYTRCPWCPCAAAIATQPSAVVIEDKERSCDSLLMCIVTVLSHGLRSGGGVGDVLRKPSKEVCKCPCWTPSIHLHFPQVQKEEETNAV